MPDKDLEHLYWGGFTRVNESIHPEKLEATELVSLDNMRLDEEGGIATTRKGFSRYHERVDTTGKINSIYDVIDPSGDNYLLAQIGTKLRKSLGGTGAYSDVKTGLTNAKLRMAVYGDKFYFANDNEKPFYSDLTNTYDMAIEKPGIANVVVAYGGTPGGNERWSMWVVVYVTDDGQQSNMSRKFSLSYPYDTVIYDVDITNIPVSSDPRVVSKKLYRTKEGDLQNFYLVAILDNATTSYTDTTPDDSLDTSDICEYLNTPLKSKYLSTNNERIVAANFTKYAANRVIPPEQYPDDPSWVIDETQAGNMDAGIYKYGLSCVDKSGNESEIVPFFTYTLAASSKRIDFYMVGFPVRSYTDVKDPTTYVYDLSIKYIRVYRTHKNESTYYFLKDFEVPIPLSSGYYYPTYDSVNDSTLTIAYPKSSHSYTEELALKSTLIYSNLYKPLEFPELNLQQIYPDDNDEITGVFDDENGVMVFKQKSICKLYTVGDPTNWYIKKLVENIGSDEPDSIFKYGKVYFFMYNGRPYYFDGSSQPQNIGETRKLTFDSVTEITGSTFWNKGMWYILTVKIGTLYYLLCYDTKLQGWYKFSVGKADVITRREFGDDVGKLLMGGNLYLIDYDESAISDTDSGITNNINILIKTKDFVVDNFANMRLMRLYLNYRGLGVTIPKILTSKLTNPSDALVNYSVDTDNTAAENNFYLTTDGMIGTLKRVQKINYSISGFGLQKFYNARLDYNIELWGTKRRVSSAVEGFGMQQGTKAGIND
jgi:hypothetical protein